MDLVALFRQLRLALNELSRNRLVDALETQIADLKQAHKDEIATLRTEHQLLTSKLERERDLLSGECDRMRLVLMPLSSRAGAAYVTSLTPRPDRPKVQEPKEPATWDDYVKQHIAKLEADEAKEASLKKQELPAN
jgi:hypothetical protein